MKRAPRNRIWEVAIAAAIFTAIAAAAAWGWIGDSGTHINRGWANFERGRYRAALADFDHALRLEPGAAYIYANRAGARSGSTLAKLRRPSLIMIRPSDCHPTTVMSTSSGPMPGPNLASTRRRSSTMTKHCVCGLTLLALMSIGLRPGSN